MTLTASNDINHKTNNGVQNTAFNNGTTVLDNSGALNYSTAGGGETFTLGSLTATSNNVNLLLGDANNLTGGITIPRAFTAQDTDAGTITVGGQNTSGTNSYSGNFTLGATANTGKSVNLVAAAGGTASFTGNLLANGTDTTAGITVNSSYQVNGSTVNPAGAVLLSGASTYGGTTTINAGTLSVSNSGGNTARLVNTSGIVVNSSGTLLLSGTTASTDRINNSASVTLSGGIINTGGLSEGASNGSTTHTTGLGALTLSSNSTLDFGSGHSGSSVLAFADSSGQTWSGTLTLLDFTPGTDELNFATSTGLTSAQLAEISLSGFTANGLDSNGDVTFSSTAVPEPATWAGGLVLLGVVGYSQRRRFQALCRAGQSVAL